MYPEQQGNKNQKAIAAAMVVLAVIIIAVVVTVMNKKSAPSDQATNTTVNTTTTADKSTTGPPTDTSTATSDNTNTSSSNSTYKDGTYSATGSYQSPGGGEKITVSITLKDDTVTASTVSQKANNPDGEEYQSEFARNYKSQVVGKKLSAIKLSRVSGSSLTSQGFNAALEQIRTKAQS